MLIIFKEQLFLPFSFALIIFLSLKFKRISNESRERKKNNGEHWCTTVFNFFQPKSFEFRRTWNTIVQSQTAKFTSFFLSFWNSFFTLTKTFSVFLHVHLVHFTFVFFFFTQNFYILLQFIRIPVKKTLKWASPSDSEKESRNENKSCWNRCDFPMEMSKWWLLFVCRKFSINSHTNRHTAIAQIHVHCRASKWNCFGASPNANANATAIFPTTTKNLQWKTMNERRPRAREIIHCEVLFRLKLCYFYGFVCVRVCASVFVKICDKKWSRFPQLENVCSQTSRTTWTTFDERQKKAEANSLCVNLCSTDARRDPHKHAKDKYSTMSISTLFFLLSTTQSQRKPAGLSANACGRPNSNSTWISVFVFATEKVSVLYFCCFLLEMASTRKRENSHKRRVETDLASFRPPTRKQEQVSRISKFILNEKWIRCWRKSKKEKKNADRAG